MIRLSQGLVAAEPPATPLPLAGHPLPAPPPAHAPTPRGTRQYPDVTPSLIGVARHYPDVTPSLIGVARHYPDVTPSGSGPLREQLATPGASPPGLHFTESLPTYPVAHECADCGGEPRRRLHHDGGVHADSALPSLAAREALLAGDLRSSRAKTFDPYRPVRSPCANFAFQIGVGDPEFVDFRNALMIALGRASDPNQGAGPPVTSWVGWAGVRDVVWIEGFCAELTRQIAVNPRLQLWMDFQARGQVTPEIICRCIAESTRDWVDVSLSYNECVMAYGERACARFRHGVDWPTVAAYQVGADFHTLLFSPEIRCGARVCGLVGRSPYVQSGYRVR